MTHAAAPAGDGMGRQDRGADRGAGPEAVLVAGPTASGKSALALALAERTGGVIVNADALQVYADLPVLTARPTPADLARAPHRLYGHVDAAEAYSVARWMEDARRALAEARAEGRLPILVGGTGLYFLAAGRGLAPVPAIPGELRERLRASAEGQPAAALHARLATLDPATAAGLRPADRQRVLRALEVVEATGRGLLAWQADPHGPALLDPARCPRVFLDPGREAGREAIARRFDAMLAAGALEEVRALAMRHLDPALPACRAVGVLPLLDHLEGRATLPEAAARAIVATRQYAKRQRTWFRHTLPDWPWLHPADALPAVLDALRDWAQSPLPGPPILAD